MTHTPTSAKTAICPVSPARGIALVEVQPNQWARLRWPDYQRSPNKNRVNQIAKGLREGYEPGPVTLYEQNGFLNIVDGGHRVKAYMRNREFYSLTKPILAILYQEGAIEQNLTFIHENTKLRMNPTHIIRADARSRACTLIRALAEPTAVFEEAADIEDYPIKPLTLIKAGIILSRRGDDLAINSLAYLSVANAVQAFDAALAKHGEIVWHNLEHLIDYELSLWGSQGRHLLNFGVLGFAYFLAKNAPIFFTAKGLEIKTKRTHVSEERGAREIEAIDRSDYGKLAALKPRWQDLGDQLYINSSRNPVRIAGEINVHFWKNRRKNLQIWKPEATL